MDTLKEFEKLGRKAWLAGIGAYGATWNYAVDKFDETYAKTNELINDLVVEGEKIEKDLQEKLKAKVEIDSKIDELKSKLGLNVLSEAEKIDAVANKVDMLTAKIETLVKSRKVKVKPAVVNKTAVKKPVASKPAVKKPAVKKAVAKKPAVKKPVVTKTVAKKAAVKKPV
ncbi:MAG: hypothetical protein GY781_18260 [Gammaproteobacteria bacterium]|nr:hypothetical protein [Gammaproteobacteria bacterium]